MLIQNLPEQNQKKFFQKKFPERGQFFQKSVKNLNVKKISVQNCILKKNSRVDSSSKICLKGVKKKKFFSKKIQKFSERGPFFQKLHVKKISVQNCILKKNSHVDSSSKICLSGVNSKIS